MNLSDSPAGAAVPRRAGAVEAVLTRLRGAAEGGRPLERLEREPDPTAMDSLFHLGVARAARNPVLRKVIGEIRDARARRSGLLRLPAGRREHSNREHRAIVRALTDGSPDDAVAAMAHHLDRVEASLASLVRPGPPEGERRP